MDLRAHLFLKRHPVQEVEGYENRGWRGLQNKHSEKITTDPTLLSVTRGRKTVSIEIGTTHKTNERVRLQGRRKAQDVLAHELGLICNCVLKMTPQVVSVAELSSGGPARDKVYVSL